MFSFFKKKENTEFKLDEMSLPSLSQSQDLGGGVQEGVPQSSSVSPESVGSNLGQNVGVGESSGGGYGSYSNSASSGGLERSGFYPPSMTENDRSSRSLSSSSLGSGQGKNLNEDFNSAKIEEISNQLRLIDARISNLDKKMELIYQMIANEVSDETKRKFKVKSMMENLN